MSVRAQTRLSSHQLPGHLIRVLRRHADERPRQAACVHLVDGEAEQAKLTYSQLDRRARAIAARLQDMGLAGQCVLLVYPPGLDFITAFFGCLYAGCVAVPTYPPHRHRMLERFRALAADAGARIALSNASGAAQFQAMMEGGKSGRAATSSQLAWLVTDDVPDAFAERWQEPAIGADTLAMLQYTSGSTSRPKGVMLSHANLVANVHAIHQAFGVQHEDSSVFWLPMYHDMGLVGGVLVPLFAGATNISIAPATFLQSPITWLAAISKYRATISGGPNFAYDLCIRKVTDEQRAALDLSSWALAFVGAEPIEPGTLERFAAAFAPCGFRPGAFYPCYGLAEATLMVSGPRRGSGATVGTFRDTALTENRVEPVSSDAPDARRLVGLRSARRRSPRDDRRPAQLRGGRPRRTWARSGLPARRSVRATGRSRGQTRRSFDARLSDTGEGPFLRTGDLGFMGEGQLYVTGRLDDLIIVRGLNHYPQDIEATARGSHPLLESGYGAAFVVDDHGPQLLVLVQEVARNRRG